jgi:Zn-dependent M16 (insulinase) family peptidase
MKKGDIINGFVVLGTGTFERLRSETVFLRHLRTGLEVFHVINDDVENLFAFAFSTPPEDNTGLPHILEHCCLAGSEKYPVKDPFQIMMQRSVCTFLNAMTYSDRTVYPAASVLEKDYFNLFEMYGDSVFKPLLRKETFQQEGWRISSSGEGPELKGIVFNEMKGAYSDPESILYEHSSRALFLDGPYQFDSGGDPLCIPDLSYEDFCSFHKKYYAPGNCRLFLYGNIDTVKQLEFVDSVILKDFHSQSEKIVVGLSSKIQQPVNSEFPAPAVKGEDGNTISVNWLLNAPESSYKSTLLEVMAYLLLGNPGALLYKAVLDSDFADDISDVSGIDSYQKEYVFSCGIRGCEDGREKDFEAFLLKELERIVEDGIPELNLQAAINKFEFSSLEIKSGSPVGLRHMDKVMKSWIYGGNPESGLEYAEYFEKIRENLKNTPNLFEKLIKTELLENNSRSLIVVKPDESYEKKLNEKLIIKSKEKFETIEKTLLAKEESAFSVFQEIEENEDVLKCVPEIMKSDIPAKVLQLDYDTYKSDKNDIIYSNIFTNGICYISMSFDFSSIPDRLLPFMTLFSRAVFDCSLKNKSHDVLSNEIAEKLGGLYGAVDIVTPLNAVESTPSKKFIINVKALETQLSSGLELLREIVHEVNFKDFKRLKELVVEMKNDFVMHSVSSATSLSVSRAAANFSEAYAIDDLLQGYPQYGFIKKLLADFDDQKEAYADNLYSLRDSIFSTDFDLSLSCSSSLKDSTVKKLKDIFSFNSNIDFEKNSTGSYKNNISLEGVVIPANVAFSGYALKGALLGSVEYSVMKVLSSMMKSGILWDIVRNKNGAYGVSAGVNGSEEVFVFSSYRDPETVKTLEAFREALQFFAAGKIDRHVADSAVVSILGREMRPLRPGEHTLTALRRYSYGINDELRQRNFDFIKNVSISQIAEIATGLLVDFDNGAGCFSAPGTLLSSFQKEKIQIKELDSF